MSNPESPCMMSHPEPEWLSDWRGRCVDASGGLRLFDELNGIEPVEMIGTWRGTGLATGHPLDGLLEALGWYGKAFETIDKVHPLLFRARCGQIIPLNPSRMPTGFAVLWPKFARSAVVRLVFAVLRPVLRARHPSARLCKVVYRGVQSAAMIYDKLPIIDHFRRIDDRTVLGVMEMRSVAPYFFLLERENEHPNL